MHLISLNGKRIWSFMPGQIAVLGIKGIGESYFAIASAPEDKSGLEFLIRIYEPSLRPSEVSVPKGGGVAEALFRIKKGDVVKGKGPIGKGFPIDLYRGRDLMLACVGSAIAPMRSVIQSIRYRRADFRKVVLVAGAFYPQDFPFLDEIEDWRQSDIDVILTVTHTNKIGWNGKTGLVQSHFKEILNGLSKPIVLICGMKAMMEQGKDELIHLGIATNEILTNY